VHATDPLGVVEQRIVKASLFELAYLLFAVEEHVFLGPETNRPGGTRLHASGLHPVANAVHAHRALVDLLSLGIEARDIERTPAHAVLATDALLLVEVDDAVLVLHDRSGSGTSQQATRFLAMQTGILADEPGKPIVGEIHLVEAHEVPRRRGEILVALVAAEVVSLLDLKVVPFLACHLACLAADTEIDVDKLGYLDLLDAVIPTDVGPGGRRSRLPLDRKTQIGSHVLTPRPSRRSLGSL
jgi:hypothetical protein